MAERMQTQGMKRRRTAYPTTTRTSTVSRPYYGPGYGPGYVWRGPGRTRSLTRSRYYSSVNFPPETKYFDVGINASVTVAGTTWADSEVPASNYVNSSGTAAVYTDSALLPTAIGSGYGEVNGNRFRLKKLRVRGRAFANAAMDQADVVAPAAVRIILVMDEQPNGAQAQGEDIMQDIGAANENMYSYQRVAESSGRFRILKDHTTILDVSAAATDGTNTSSNNYYGTSFSFLYQPKVPKVVNIKSGNATPNVSGTVDCNIFLLAYCVRGTTASAINIVAASRAYYCD